MPSPLLSLRIPQEIHDKLTERASQEKRDKKEIVIELLATGLEIELAIPLAERVRLLEAETVTLRERMAQLEAALQQLQR